MVAPFPVTPGGAGVLKNRRDSRCHRPLLRTVVSTRMETSLRAWLPFLMVSVAASRTVHRKAGRVCCQQFSLHVGRHCDSILPAEPPALDKRAGKAALTREKGPAVAIDSTADP